MADFVRDDIGLCEVAGSPEPLVELAEERQVEIHLAIRGTVEGSNLRPTDATARLSGAVKQHEHRRHVRLAALTEYLAPRVLSIGKDDGDELCLRIVLGDTGRPDRLILRNAGCADEIERISTGEPRNEQKENESSYPTAKRQTNAHPHPATVLDISAFPSSFPAHRVPPLRRTSQGGPEPRKADLKVRLRPFRPWPIRT